MKIIAIGGPFDGQFIDCDAVSVSWPPGGISTMPPLFQHYLEEKCVYRRYRVGTNYLYVLWQEDEQRWFAANPLQILIDRYATVIKSQEES